MSHIKTRKLVYLAMLTTLAITLHIFESMIPLPLPYGVKLGFANIISLVVVDMFGVKEMFIVNFFRVIISSLMTGIFMSYPFFMSCGGVLLSSIALAIVNKLFDLPLVTRSIICAMFHNIGQILVICYVFNTLAFTSYLFIMFASAIPTGIFTGLVAIQILNRVDKNKLRL